jgi:glycosyltransferase involved in cell wall biosynthesis
MNEFRSKLPRVSICLLTYNRAHLLPRTINSLLDQTHGDFELIINDDNSNDETEQVCCGYAKGDSRIRYFKNSRNLRYAGNQNAAMLRATTDFVAIVHDGDIYRSDLIEKWTSALVAEPTAALVFNAVNVMDSNGRVVQTFTHPYSRLVPGLDLFEEMIRSSHSPIFGIVMVRKSCVKEVGPFDPRLPVLGDVDMWLRLLLRYDAAYISESLLTVSPREVGHHNNPTNWNVRLEHESIYLWNTKRRYPDDPAKVMILRREITHMIWHARLMALLYCLYYGNIRALLAGLRFIVRRWNFMSIRLPERNYTWDEVRC